MRAIEVASPTCLPRARVTKGFALVITLSLMVLLTLLAVGLLSLSAVSLRASFQGNDMAIARANARMALVIAIGELQKSIGPDKRVTAPSEITVEKPGRPRLMGVWKSWNYNPSANPDYTTNKADNFVGWLASDRDYLATQERDYASKWGKPAETIQLIGPNALGVKDPDPGELVNAGKVPVYQKGVAAGAYAWHVSDESVKARVNSYRDPSQNQTLWQRCSQLAGHRPDATAIKASDGTPLNFMPLDDTVQNYTDAREKGGKLVSLNQTDLLDEGRKIARFRNHVSLYSAGLPTNVRDGGLKQDLSSVFGYSTTGLPPAFTGSGKDRLYASTHKITGVSDPYWSTLKGYYDVYKEPGISTYNPIYYKVPQEAVTLAQSTPPKKFYPAPVIERVELLFSLAVRDSHGPWSPGSTGRPDLTRMIHLLYAPIITLHNPYNVSLKFDQMDLDFKGIPMAFNFTVNGEPQNNEPVSLNELFVNAGTDRFEKSFYLSISNWSDPSSGAPSPITMTPGQTLVCGPYIDPNAIFGTNGYEGAAKFFDYDNNLTGRQGSRARFKPGFQGRQVSYDVDWLTLNEHASGYSTDGNRGTLIVKPTDQFFVEWKVKSNTGNIRDKLTVNATLTVQGTSLEYGGLEFDYDPENTALQKMYPGTFRYPDSRSVPSTLQVENLYHENHTPISSHTKVKSFALVSAYARTANGGVYDNGTRDKIAGGQNLLLDGRLAGRPFLHHNPARTPTVVDLKTDLPGRYSHELNFQPLAGSVDDILNIDSSNRGYSLISNKVTRGIKSGSYLELPVGPMQTIADFRRSNALTSSLLPHFVQPVANSYASPLMSTASVNQSGVVRYALLDHSVLANHALYDRFYFSTFAAYGNKGADVVFADFASGAKPLLNQSFEFYLPEGRTPASAKAELFASGKPTATAYQTAAEYQVIRGPFNVNSADVEAWKAVLSSMSNSMIQTLWGATATAVENKSTSVPILPMALVNAVAVGGAKPADMAPPKPNMPPNVDNMRTNDWSGYRQLAPYQLELLAQKIVEEVRKRGPFLSMSEFVNRRIGADSELTRVGALQAAIDKANINDDLLKGYVTDVRLADVTDDKVYKLPTPMAAVGNPAAGAPGWVSQGDLMRILEPGATVRGDTFVIRVCGEATDARGRVTARAYAEALVQRVPEYLNGANRPSINVWDAASKDALPENIAFGRRLKLVAFKWLAPSEI